ncbi:MAG: PQQ-binding-like beta-propeller repeat protein [Pirellulales bacterium]
MPQTILLFASLQDNGMDDIPPLPRGLTAPPNRGAPAGLLFVLVALCAHPAAAGDWPQILGPHRSGLADGEQLAETWPADGPKLEWQHAVGNGFAGAAVLGSRAVVFHRLGGELLGEGLDPTTGKVLWKVAFPTNYSSQVSYDDGPRCVPLLHEGRAFLLGPAGELQCVDLATGKKLWYRNLYQEFDAPDGYFGAGSSPILEGGKLLINVGGQDGAGIVALSPADGKTIWKSTDEAASYSSPTAATLDNVRHVMFVTRLNVVSIDPANGKVRFRFPFGARGPTVNAANPLILGDHLFVSASYGVGAKWAKIGAQAATTEWESDDVMSSQYTTCVESGGFLYGIDGRQDVGVARLRCVDPRQGKVLWTKEGFGTGSLILADGKLVILSTEGVLTLANPSPQEFQPLATARLFDSTVQALPALASGRLLARDTKTLKCFRVGKL